MRPEIVYLQAVLMPNGEVIHFGKTLGFLNEREWKRIREGNAKLTSAGNVVVELGDHVK